MAKTKKWKYANIDKEKVYETETGLLVGFISREKKK